MLERFIQFFHEIPRYFRYALYRVMMHRRWVVLTFLVSSLIMFITVLAFKILGTIDITQASINYRLTGLITFAVIWIAIYNNYRLFPRDYYVTRHFNSSPFLHVALSGLLYGLTLFLLMVVMITTKSINTDTTWFGVFFYSLMSLFFMITLSFLFGVIYMLYPKLNQLYIIISVVLMLLLPIFYLPDKISGVIGHLLMLNPLYYLVNGMQQSVIVGHDAVNHLGYHLYFCCFMGLMIVFSFALRDYVTQLKPNEHSHSHLKADEEETAD
ncbi:teichoic acid translocation permease [Staphylococcus muscae]|uniref:Membrane protein n=1 Tax=Staphylococcus muscae TaxID=1294 RepID=A0A240C7T1_9STAP|nr:ABC transporter permease [Staphylococcus muscae]AVQ33376.1 teichoic acid translocation permease [Staphylococcus muscae]PNZ03243.1 teichoic acid translocation permease [Staphylococcus muscae]GGA89679.1 membrane protein [Staphylococcus muscae]SNW03128.1 membrane protein [Staphylococcus muscae]